MKGIQFNGLLQSLSGRYNPLYIEQRARVKRSLFTWCWFSDQNSQVPSFLGVFFGGHRVDFAEDACCSQISLVEDVRFMAGLPYFFNLNFFQKKNIPRLVHEASTWNMRVALDETTTWSCWKCYPHLSIIMCWIACINSSESISLVYWSYFRKS